MNRLLPILSFSLLASVASAQAPSHASAIPRSSGTFAEAAPPRYQVRELARSAWGLAIPMDINDRSVVVGGLDVGDAAGSPRHAVVWENGKTTDLTPDPAYTFANAMAINNQGVVSGTYVGSGTLLNGGFRWHAGSFDVLPTFAPGQQAGYGVSERGFVLGKAMNEQFKIHASYWDRDLELVDLGDIGPGSGSAYDANGWDVIVGTAAPNFEDTSAFLWRGGSMVDLGTLPGWPFATAHAINEHNEIVGYSGDYLQEHAFYWSSATGMIELPGLTPIPRAYAFDINDGGVIVGYSYDAEGHRVGVAWHGGVPYELSTLLVNGEGWELFDALGLNELGQIVGFGRRDGDMVAYLLTPVDQPLTTVIGLVPGTAGVANTIEVVGATPGAEIALLYGGASEASLLDASVGVEVDIAAARNVVVRADASGAATACLHLPTALRGKRLAIQAVDLSNLDVSNLVVRTID